MLRHILITCLVLLCGVLKVTLCLYEDQIGKFDWRQKFVGKLKFSEFDNIVNTKKVILATEKNVIAAVSIKTGEILWRQILERTSAGVIHYLGVGSHVITVTGDAQTSVRGWNLNAGFLEWEWTLPPSPKATWFTSEEGLSRVVLHGDAIEVTTYHTQSGAVLSTRRVDLPWATEESQCLLSAKHLFCLGSDGVLHSADLSPSAPTSPGLSRPVAELFPACADVPATLELVAGATPLVVLACSGATKQPVSAALAVLTAPVPADAGLATATYEGGEVLLAVRSKEGGALETSGWLLDTGAPVSELSGSASGQPSDAGQASVMAASCPPRRDRGRGPACRAVVSTSCHAASLVLLPPGGRVAWTREEALASVASVEMLELPLSDADSAIEGEFGHDDPSFLGLLLHRLSSQALQLVALASALLAGASSSPGHTVGGLERDEFGLRRMIVAATEAGVVFGMDNRDGTVVWRRRVPGVEPYGDDTRRRMPVFVQRTTRHFPYTAQCAMLARDKVSGNGVLFTFDPLTGRGTAEALGRRVRQASLLHVADRDHVRPLLLLVGDQADLEVRPVTQAAREAVASVATSTYLFEANPATGSVAGYSLAFVGDGGAPQAGRVWEARLARGGQRVTAVVAKNPQERVHSQGRVLGDRSVLYKYNNPNLVAVVTEGEDPVHKYLLNVHLLDVVSGAVVFSACHRRAHAPVHVVHSENWLVYTYFSERARRTEVASLELYEGKTQGNTTAFSSGDSSSLQPIVDRQAYILPSMVEALRETITEKGITSKHLLAALPGGGVLEMPRAYVDPRRPVTVTPEAREEGVIPYAPELPTPADHVINYNRSVLGVGGIHTSPSGLESTSLVLVYGLDLFYTRVAPSKTFDVLKEDFDHVLITAVLAALALASYGSRRLASKKALRQAWK